MWNGPARPPRPRAAAPRRYGWLRLYSDFPTHPKWRVIARKTGVPVAHVLSIATTLLCKANVAQVRGSLVDFSVLECAAGLDLPIEHVDLTYAAMEELGWIERQYLVTWDERQPDREDPTNSERQKRFRDKKKTEGRIPTAPQFFGTDNNARYVTEKSLCNDQTRLESKKEASDEEPGRKPIHEMSASEIIEVKAKRKMSA